METVEEFIIRIDSRFGSKRKSFGFAGETEYEFLKRVFAYYPRRLPEKHIKMRILFKEFEANIDLQKKTENFLDMFFIHETENLALSSAELNFIGSTLLSILPYLSLFCVNLLKIKKINHIFLKRFSAIHFILDELNKTKNELNNYFVTNFCQSEEYKKVHAKVDEWKNRINQRSIHFNRPKNVPLAHWFWD